MLRRVDGSFRRFGGAFCLHLRGLAIHKDFVGCWALKMEAVRFSKTSVNICWSTRNKIQEDFYIQLEISLIFLVLPMNIRMTAVKPTR